MNIMNKQVRNKRQKTNGKRKAAILIATLCIIIGFGILYGSLFADARDSEDDVSVNYKYYKSIAIEAGDSLWSIAQEYKTDSCSTEDYINEIMELNSLTSEEIHESQHLMIVYYDKEFK